MDGLQQGEKEEDKKMKRRAATFGMCIVFFLLLAMQTFALGVAPSKNLMDHTTQKVYHTFTIINNDNEDMDVVILPQGELAQYIGLEQQYLSMSKGEQEKEVTYSVTLPQDISPGPHEAILLVAQVPRGASSGSQPMIGSLLSVEHALVVDVPYPGIFAQGTMFIKEADVNETMTFSANIINRGSEVIHNVEGEVIIRSPTNAEIKRIKTARLESINPQTQASLSADYIADINPGVYYAEFVVNYEDKQFVMRDTFTVDKMTAAVSKVIVDDFRLGYISRVDIEAINIWNQPMQDVYAILEVIDESGSIISKTQTASSDLVPYTTTRLSGYWDSKGVSAGEYDMQVSLYYNGEHTQKRFSSVIGIDEVRITDTSLTANATRDVEGSSKTLLYIFVAVLLLANTYLAYIAYRNSRSPKNNMPPGIPPSMPPGPRV